MATHFTLDGIAMKTPQQFKIEDYNITESKRLLNGTMVMDLIAQKKKFYLTYETLTTAEKDQWMNLLVASGKCFFTLSYEEDGILHSAIVYSGAFSRQLARAPQGGSWIWKDVEVHLIER